MEKLFSKYLNKQQHNNTLINAPAHNELKLIVIIPAYNEPNILQTLNSLFECRIPKFACEVIVLINDSEVTTLQIQEQNFKTKNDVQNWINHKQAPNLTFHCTYVKSLPKKHAGAGLARKLAMDEAIRRFYKIKNYNGIIASLDADTLVSPNYLNEIQKSFSINKRQNCAIFNFEHQITSNLPSEQKRAIILYELYLRYFKQALAYTGFPHAFHTIGSCFAVAADAYVKQGGMNRRQGGEDFYFLHKIFPLKGTIELTTVTVYPSSRISNRVPFGTGPALAKILDDGDYFTYNPVYFQYLKQFFSNINQLYNCTNPEIEQYYEKQCHFSIKNFISIDEFTDHISEINKNSSSETTFVNRFYNWFDAFKVIKYLNYVHINEPRIPISEATKLFFKSYNKNFINETDLDLLMTLRKLELKKL